MQIADHISARESELINLCERYGVVRLSLFGSALRDDFDPEGSDLDFSVVFSGMQPEERAAAYFGLIADLERLFGRKVDLVELSAIRNPYIRRSIENGQQTVYVAA